MATITPATANAVGDAFTGRSHDDDFDPKNAAGTYTHNERIFSATHLNELENEILLLSTTGDNITLRNNSGGVLTKGTLLSVPTWDATNDVYVAVKADADAGDLPALWVLDADVADTATGVAKRRVTVTALNTNSFNEGDALYLDTTAGGYTATAPTAANALKQFLGVVSVKSATVGEIAFNIQPPLKVGSNELQANSVGAAALTAAAQDEIPNSAISKDNEGDTAPNTIRFTFQAQDLADNNLAANTRLNVWISTSSYGAPSATGNTVAVSTGVILRTFTANAHYSLITNASGVAAIDVTITGAATRFVHSEVGGKIVNLSATWV